jgi:hypothetical protein
MLHQEHWQVLKQYTDQLPILIKELTPYQQTLVQLYFYEGLSAAQIAKQLNKANHNTVSANLRYLFKKLHHKLTGTREKKVRLKRIPDNTVNEIRQRWGNGEFENYVDVARQYNLSRVYASVIIRRLVRKNTWNNE